MPETPDFPAIARQILADADDNVPGPEGGISPILAAHLIAEQLRLVWNARGAADLAKLEIAFGADDEGYERAPSMKTLDRALRTLDR